MIIQILISLTLFLILLIVMAIPVRNTPVKLAVGVCLGAGAVVTWNPELSTRIANAIGVGRGTDLLLYLWILVTMLLALLFAAVNYRQRREITRLTRSLALLEERVSRLDENRSGESK